MGDYYIAVWKKGMSPFTFSTSQRVACMIAAAAAEAMRPEAVRMATHMEDYIVDVDNVMCGKCQEVRDVLNGMLMDAT